MKQLQRLLPLLLLFPAAATAAPDKYAFDKDHTHILFFVDHEGFSNTVGRVKDFDGYFTFDAKEPEGSEVDVTLKAASIDTDVPELNKALMGEKFFNAASFPTMRFKSTGIGGLRAGAAGNLHKQTGDVTGELTLLGVSRPVTLHVVYNKSGIHPFTNNYVSGFSADAVIKRSDFGMNAYIPDVGDKVRVHIETEGIDPLRHPGNIRTPH